MAAPLYPGRPALSADAVAWHGVTSTAVLAVLEAGDPQPGKRR